MKTGLTDQLDKRARLQLPRVDPPLRDQKERIGDFCEVYLEYTPEAAVKEAVRCVECKNPLCERACPLHNHIRDWLVLTARGEFLEAAALSQITNPMPEICGRICPQDRLCEAACIVGIKNQPVAIGAIERFINEYSFLRLGGIPMPRRAEPTRKQVAIVGSGPAGLACAEELWRRGHAVTIFESHPQPGGLLRYGIPRFKLGRWVVERRIAYLMRLGIQFVCHVQVGRDLPLDELFERGFAAIFLGTGAQRAKQPDLPGMDLEGVQEALPFLIQNNLQGEERPSDMERDQLRGEKVAVLGGGDTAMDCVRTAVRLGAAQVLCLYRRDEENMPGSRREITRAKEEGVEFHFLTTPIAFIGDAAGHVRQVECLKMQLGEPDASGRRSPIPIPGSTVVFEVHRVILALGFDADPVQDEQRQLQLTKWGTYEVDDEHMTSWPGIFAGGDGVRGADLLVTALKDGREAAEAMHRYLSEHVPIVASTGQGRPANDEREGN